MVAVIRRDTVEDRLNDEIKERADTLKLASDWADFKERCGFLAGLEKGKEIVMNASDEGALRG